MTKQEYDKLLDALWTIKEHCDLCCRNCILYNDIDEDDNASSICSPTDDAPCNWDLPERKVKE